MRFAINLPNFGPYGDPRLLADLAHEAEDAGWDGFFICKQVSSTTLCPRRRASAGHARLTISRRRDCGLVRPGMEADLVVSDAATVNDRSTDEDPEQPPIGLPHVLAKRRLRRTRWAAHGRPGKRTRSCA
jgi:hypothetical protein